MAIKLNLLPEGYGATGNLGKVLKITKSLGVIAFAFFIIFTIGISVFFVISSVALKNLNTDNDLLKNQIASEEQTENQLVLLKDRISKIKLVLNSSSVTKNLTVLEPFLSTLGGSSSLTDLSVDSQKISLSAAFRTNDDMSNFIKNVSSSTAFNTIVATSFGFNPTTGYVVSLKMDAK